MKTRLLTGRALDYAVALAEGHKLCDVGGLGATRFDGLVMLLPNGGHRHYILDTNATRAEVMRCDGHPFGHDQRYWLPTRNQLGDDIIDREHISTTVNHSGTWIAYLGYNLNDERQHMHAGATRREAAMRCYVAFRLGKNVDIPKELQ